MGKDKKVMEKVVCLKTSQSKCLKGLKCVEELTESSVITVGNFDGVHKGHKHLLERVISRAKEKKLRSVVLSFYPHPLKILSPAQAPCELTNMWERARLMVEEGVDWVIFIKFDRRFSSLVPRSL